MYIFLEKFIEKKIKIAKYLYIKNGNLDFSTFHNNHTISKTTFQRYVKELVTEYEDYYINGNLYNTYALTQITTNLLKQSDLLFLFKSLVLNPGKDSSFYRETLLLSPAKFARLISQIKKILALFNITVEVESGYWIKGKKEYEVIFLLAYITTFYNMDKDELYAILPSELLAEYQYYTKKNILVGHYLELELLNNIYLITLIRDTQYNKNKEVSKKDLFKMHLFLKRTFEDIQYKYYDKCQLVIDTIYGETITNINREKFVDLICKFAFYIEIFPYKFNLIDLRQEFIVERMYENFPTRKYILERLISKIERLTTIPLKKRMHSLVHFIIALDIITFEEYKPFSLGVYSSFGKQHLDFLIEKISFLDSCFNNSLNIIPLLEKDDHLKSKENMLILTNIPIDSCANDDQYLISDFLTLTDVSEFGVWLHKKTSYTRKY